MLKNLLHGTGVALVTPFNANHEIDFDALGRLIDFDIAGGVEYFVTLGTTGETATLSKEEKIAIINFTYDYVNDRLPVIVGIGGNDTRELINDFNSLPLDKALAILSVSPYYSRPSQEGIFQHYKALAAEAPKPIILYNVPARTGRNINAHTALRLANEVENIAGIKEAGDDMAQCMLLLRDRPKDFLIVSGDDALAMPQLACGMDGVISVAANSFPRQFSEMVRFALKGDLRKAKELNDQLIEGYNILFAENNPAGVKAALASLGLIKNFLRLPLVPLSKGLHSHLKDYLDQSARKQESDLRQIPA